MMASLTEEMWKHFVPLWTELRAESQEFALAGGYGLLLKHQWLQANEKVRTALSWRDWVNPVPRVTKDIDLVVGLELIASQQDQAKIIAVLRKQGFEVEIPHWKFKKRLDGDRSILLDLHAVPPASPRPDVLVAGSRIRPNPSLKGEGIHGREQAEAVGWELRPFSFQLENIPIVVPHPVSWSLMKLTAMSDRFTRSQDSGRSNKERGIELELAVKHARDVCRAVAMMSQDEYTGGPAIVDKLKPLPPFQNGQAIHEKFFRDDSARGCEYTRDQWTPEGFRSIRQILSAWYG